MKLAFKLALAIVMAAGSYFVWRQRQSGARDRLRAIDEGRICAACFSDLVTVDGDRVACGQCGHESSLKALRSVQMSAREIAAVTRPDVSTDHERR
jgi:hypothetical protein